ncbi:MAG TPA: T9SS type A sorting domain-containing protein [Bacteroidetes bacterium]|nr:T9SS type A sorting domain-containing protein [Bacteroidota bacterium]
MTYEWRKAVGGVNYGGVIGTESVLYVEMPSTINQLVTLKLKVTSSLAGTLSVTNFIIVQPYGCDGFTPPGFLLSESNIGEVSVFPNPTSGRLTFEIYSIEEFGKGSISINDQYGKTIKTIGFDKLYEGKNSFSGKFDDLPNGLYYFNVKIGKEYLHGKFNILK